VLNQARDSVERRGTAIASTSLAKIERIVLHVESEETDMTTSTSAATQAATDTSATVDRIASSAHQTVDRLASVANSAASQLNVKADDLMAAKDRWAETCTTYVKENPFVALGIAVAAGFLLSRWMR
jgi:ElaB/YqjD/DUF883 family membrane-anchored ribosome-binding protein